MNKEKTLYPELPILIVDDEVEFLKSFQRRLRDEGINNTEICPDSREVMPLLKEKEFSLILLDIEMPGITGTELLPKIKKYFNKTKVVMLTAYNSGEKAFECNRKGAEDYIVKIEDVARIVEKIKKALNAIPTFFEIEASYYKEVMARSGQNKTKAAEMAGMHRRTFTSRLGKIEKKLNGKNLATIPMLSELLKRIV